VHSRRIDGDDHANVDTMRRKLNFATPYLKEVLGIVITYLWVGPRHHSSNDLVSGAMAWFFDIEGRKRILQMLIIHVVQNQSLLSNIIT
jgi:hypothetical protein